jgi:tRNA 2-thiouridine synthesizing protein E
MVLAPATAASARVFIARPGFDADGYLIDGAAWSRDMAEELARAEGIESLGPVHWKVIHLVRERYFSLGALPVMRLVCRAAGLDRASAHDLFSGCASLWRIAGLPNPGEEARAYMN